MDITELLSFTKKSGASDLHISTGNPPMVRVHGEMRKLKLPPFSKDDIHHLIYDIMSDEQKKIFEENKEIDFSQELGGIASSLSTSGRPRSSIVSTFVGTVLNTAASPFF